PLAGGVEPSAGGVVAGGVVAGGVVAGGVVPAAGGGVMASAGGVVVSAGGGVVAMLSAGAVSVVAVSAGGVCSVFWPQAVRAPASRLAAARVVRIRFVMGQAVPCGRPSAQPRSGHDVPNLVIINCRYARRARR